MGHLSFHHSINSSFHHSINSSFHHSINSSFHHSIIPSFHHSIIPSIHHSIIPPCPLSIPSGFNPDTGSAVFFVHVRWMLSTALHPFSFIGSAEAHSINPSSHCIKKAACRMADCCARLTCKFCCFSVSTKQAGYLMNFSPLRITTPW